jgi:MFS family permease
MFSFLQFISSTFIGSLSDIYGRKKVLLLVMFGTLISYLLWSVSSVFTIFLLSRFIGGISKGNISLCIAIMTDLTDMKQRSSALALVGIAFSLGFLFGPCIGAVFSSKLSATATIYLYPSYLAIFLTVLNLLFVAKFLEESLPTEKRAKSINNSFTQSLQFINPVSLLNFSPIKTVKSEGFY